MLNRFKNVVSTVMGGIQVLPDEDSEGESDGPRLKYPYQRPDFLQLTPEEVQVSADHDARPIMVPRQIQRLPWNAGYAEVINSGKSRLNEDQARAETMFVRRHVPGSPRPPGAVVQQQPTAAGPGSHSNLNGDHGNPEKMASGDAASEEGANTAAAAEDFRVMEKDPLPFTYFAIFDGHAGAGAAIMAVNLLHLIIQAQLGKVRELLIARRYGMNTAPAAQTGKGASFRNLDKSYKISADGLVVGALEAAFHEMDSVIEQQRLKYRISGGCTALVALFFLGKLYVANAGDCRAVLVRKKEVQQMSTDFTPESERKRLQYRAYLHPELLHEEFTHLEFTRRITRKDVGKKVLYRDAWMTGWSSKTVTDKDIRFPLIYGEGKRARVLATIGVTRGFGDHDLTVYNTDIPIKPFLIPTPEVQIYDMSALSHSPDDVLIMGSDGLWDVTTNHKAAYIVHASLEQFEPSESCRYTSAAQDLVMFARGLLKKSWRTTENSQASGDDITVFVIPLHAYLDSQVTETGGVAMATGGHSGVAMATGGNSGVAMATGGNSGVAMATGGNSEVTMATAGNSGVSMATDGNSDVAIATGGLASEAMATAELAGTATDELDEELLVGGTEGIALVENEELGANAEEESLLGQAGEGLTGLGLTEEALAKPEDQSALTES